MGKQTIAVGSIAVALACTACTTVPTYVPPVAGAPTAEITYVRIANAVPGYFDEDLQVGATGCGDFRRLAIFRRGDRDNERSQPRSLTVGAASPACFRLYVDELYTFHGLLTCTSVFEMDVAPGGRYTIEHLYQVRSVNNVLNYRCSPKVTDTVTGAPIEVRIVEQKPA